jgi:alpha-L-fucosidase
MLVECVAKGGNMLLNVGPTALGEITAESVDILQKVGRWMEYNGASIYGCGRSKLPKPEWGYYTQNGRTLYAHMLKKPVGPILLLGLSTPVRKARLLADGSEVALGRPWNAGTARADAIFLALPGVRLLDPLDTVVALELNENS